MLTSTEKDQVLNQLKEKIDFYEYILNNLPAIVYINEIDQGGDINTLRNIWANKWGLDFIGYKQEEITEMGYDFAKMVTHSDDFKLAPEFLDFHKNENGAVYYSFKRQKPKNQEDYKWVYQRTTTLKRFPDGSPKQSLNIAFELHKELHTPNQLVSFLKEINCLKYALKLKSLTRREYEILKLITKGLTDKEIGTILKISIATAKTHRNKILKKLELKNSASLAAFATECGV